MRKWRGLLLQKQDLEAARFRKYDADPIGFVTGGLGGFAWSKQRLIMESVRDNRRTAVPSCHDVGKSAIAGRIGAWWLSSFEQGETFLVTAAPTFRQVKNILWREIGRLHRKNNLPGRVNQTEWHLGGELVGFGVSPADADPSAMQGIHARRVLVILDEACGVAKAICDAADTLIANEECRILAIGNPDDPTAEFANFCKPGSGWNVIPISAFDSPRFTDEPIPAYLRPLLVSPTWVEEKRRSWGEGSPLWKSKILGEFPEQSDDALIPLKFLNQAQNAELKDGDPIELGVDVARFGDDFTVCYIRRGNVARRRWKYNGRDTMTTSNNILKDIRDTGAKKVKIDDTGVGGGVTDRLMEMKREGLIPKDVEIVPINVGSGAITLNQKQEPIYVNLRAELHWQMRERFFDGLVDLDPKDEDLLGQAANIQYALNSQGLIQIEKKEDMKKRLGGQPGHSPDDWDALVLCFAVPNFAGSGILEWYRRQAAEKANPTKPKEVREGELVKMASSRGASTAYGITGRKYDADGSGVFHIEPDDVPALQAAGFTVTPSGG